MERGASAAAPAGGSDVRVGGLLAALLTTSFMVALASLALAPAFGSLAEAYDLSLREVTWVFSIYILANLAGLPLMSRLSDLYGRKPIFMLNIALFCLGSLAAALAPSYPLLLAARALQAFGGASVSPVSSAIIGDVIPRERQGFALGLAGTMWAIAGLLGPAIGGVVVQNLGWQWVFALNIPFGLVALFLAWRFIPNLKAAKQGKLDVWGVTILTLAVVALSFGLSRLDGTQPFLGALDPTAGGLILAGLLAFIPWAIVENRVPNPLVRLDLLRRVQISAANAIGFAGGFLTPAVTFIPAYAAISFGFDLQVAALMSAIPAVVQFVGTPSAGRILDKLGSRTLLIGCAIFTTAGMGTLSFVAGSFPGFVVGLVLIGVGFSGLLGGPLRYIVIGETAPSERGIANAIIAITSSIGSAVGFAISGAALAFGGEGVGGFRAAYATFMVVAGLSFVAAVFLKNRAAERAHRPESAAPPSSIQPQPTPASPGR
jgi:MFS family permease